MSIQPQGEDLRKAIRWISDGLQHEPDKTLRALIEEACLKFNLSPVDADYLTEFYKNPS